MIFFVILSIIFGICLIFLGALLYKKNDELAQRQRLSVNNHANEEKL